VDPSLGSYPEFADIRPTRFGRFVRVSLQEELPAVEAMSAAEIPSSLLGRIGYYVKRIVLGAPLESTAIAYERMRKLVALPVLSADALSSVAYGPEAMLAILVLGGSAALGYTLPIAAVIAFLMLTVGLSYRQTIRAYPHGGGSYIVASDNLGRMPGLVAAAGLLTDYILTVAVSVASGVAAITSAIPSLAGAAVPLGIGVIVVLLAGNLRGVRQAGVLFAAPTYAFIFAIFALVVAGLLQAAGRGFQPLPPPRLHAMEGVSVLLLLRAFTSGATAMTGIEAISNAVPAFQPVEWRNARTTLTWMVGLLIALFAGTVALIHLNGVVPNARETVLSQLAHRTFDSGFMYAFIQAATAAILLLAANTAYNDFPRVLFLLARDRYAPRIFLRLGDRLAFSNGIILLSVVATIIYVVFGGQTELLIPLYAVGVFLAFTLSQAGMVVHWWRVRDAHWLRSLFFNAVGCLLSAIVFLTAGFTKFTEGAWVALLTIGLFILVALRIRRHYDLAALALALEAGVVEVPQPQRKPAFATRAVTSLAETEETPEEIHHLVVVPIASLDRAAMRALAYAASLQQPVLALHLSPTGEEAKRFREYWRLWGNHLPLVVVVSPYRAIVAPMINYIEVLHWQRPDLTVTVILPEIVVRHWWHRILHSQTASHLRHALRPLPKIVVTTIPFHLPN
ncbi:MAG TPA: APC family permease, partial [Ktedonobacteraceae bacterium]|nr:APC family permease [Ktedonobacteraceae bacterium]